MLCLCFRISKIRFFILLLLILFTRNLYSQGLTTKTYNPGQVLSNWMEGGRLATWHNGYIYMIGLVDSYVWDISDPEDPQQVNAGNGSNGHRWAKMGNAFSTDLSLADVQGTGYNFLDLSVLPDLEPYKGTAQIPIKGDTRESGIWTYPHKYTHGDLIDVRTGNKVGDVNPRSLISVYARNNFRIGNLWFYSPGDDQSGVAIIDVGNPGNPKILDELKGDIRQYTTTFQIWRHYLILMVGKNSNQGGNNLIAVDFEDPTNLNVAFGFPTSLIGASRYIMFQDEFGFCGISMKGYKINMETKEVVQQFVSVTHMSDFQWIPLGHLVLQTASESCGGCRSQSHIFSHQAALDTKPPTVGYHLPKNGALKQPLGTVVGLVINETLQDATLNNQSILIRPVNGQPIQTDIVSYSFNVINVAPRELLKANTSYEVELVQGGIKDVAGNGIQNYKFYFSTGNTLNLPDGVSVRKNNGQNHNYSIESHHEKLTLKLHITHPGTFYTTITDLRGVVRESFHSTGPGNFTISTSDWSKGVYQVKVTGENSELTKSVFIQ